jgi:hypothetical protein
VSMAVKMSLPPDRVHMHYVSVVISTEAKNSC